MPSLASMRQVTVTKKLWKKVTLPATTDVSELLSSQLARQRLECRQCFLKLLSNVWFLSRQGLAFRRHGDEWNSNFMHFINLRLEDNKKLIEWLKQNSSL